MRQISAGALFPLQGLKKKIRLIHPFIRRQGENLLIQRVIRLKRIVGLGARLLYFKLAIEYLA